MRSLGISWGDRRAGSCGGAFEDPRSVEIYEKIALGVVDNDDERAWGSGRRVHGRDHGGCGQGHEETHLLLFLVCTCESVQASPSSDKQAQADFPDSGEH